MRSFSFAVFLLVVGGKSYGVENPAGLRSDAKSLNEAIDRLANSLPRLVEKAFEAKRVQLSRTSGALFGAVTIGAGLLAIGSTYVETPLHLNESDLQVHLTAGQAGLYALGAGLPPLLNQPSPPNCGSGLHQVFSDYGFVVDSVTSGIVDFRGRSGPAVVDEFETVLRAELGCVIAMENDFVQAARVAWAVDEMFAALRSKLSIVEGRGAAHKRCVRDTSADEPSQPDRRFLPEALGRGAGAHDLSDRIESVRSEILELLPTAVSVVEIRIAMENRAKFTYFLLNFLGMAVGMFGASYELADGVENYEVIDLGTQALVGYASAGSYAFNYQSPRLACGVDDFLKVVGNYKFLDDELKSSQVEDLASLSFRITEQTNALRKSMYCVTSLKGSIGIAAKIDALIGLHSILQREVLNVAAAARV